MGVYVVIGAVFGMGAEIARQLREAGHKVISVDVQDGDVVADLSTPEGRSSAARALVAQLASSLLIAKRKPDA